MNDKDLECVDIIASGYEWICPECNEFNKEIEITEIVVCSCCGAKFEANPPEHAYSQEFNMVLKCECGNEFEFYETTTVTFIVDSESSREEKVNEETHYYCLECDKEVYQGD